MSRVRGLALGLVAIMVSGRCLAEGPKPTSDPAAAKKAEAASSRNVAIGEFVIAQPIRVQNLAVFPILSKSPKNEDRYITLEEGLKSGKVQVYEVGADPRSQAGGPAEQAVGQRPSRTSSSSRQSSSRTRPADTPPRAPAAADVNHLMVVNHSGKPLYLMPGEIIYGGQQDRCVGQESIVQADGKPVKIEVYCVEHGRWSYRTEAEASAEIGRLAGDPNLDEQGRRKLALETKKGKFVVQAGNLGKSGRAAVQEGRGQQEVWNEVGKANSASGAQTATGAFTANYSSPEIGKRIDAYVRELEKPVADHSQVVGAMVAVDGKIESVDVFGSTPLFQKIWPKLLRSHALDAAIAGQASKPAKTAPAATLRDAEVFFSAAIQGDVKGKNQGKSGLVVTRRESAGVVSFSASENAQAAPQAAGMGGFGSVHSSGYSK